MPEQHERQALISKMEEIASLTFRLEKQQADTIWAADKRDSKEKKDETLKHLEKLMKQLEAKGG